ncbi:hypothetical protein TSTA_085510 [Talaromyces stipitatus ATCC 10500]|uniref:Uncharacterized protein n=1 Tax=Talaromyces stipitatus (strain ATCC 10500 / CBS 375.48 / QM 6759 / NRRL 1006) TaxID=441959 RepID=B8M1U2_TALSN|nr:uncharacterized protein TSTA_085510 [Talaromyces stipitatus ATCC 10500]EED21320.1 hypothetical protein TSTA_085510 [Talaromyces stipitatus ATCC 10500]
MSQALRDVFTKFWGHHFYRFYPIRNDLMINSWNRYMLMAWLANIDIAPCTGTEALLEYIAKYVAKAETKTESYKDLMKGFLLQVNEKNLFLSAVNDEESLRRGLSSLEKYKNHQAIFEHVTYLQFL